MMRVLLCALLATYVAAGDDWTGAVNVAISACLKSPLQFEIARQCAALLQTAANAANSPGTAKCLENFETCVVSNTKDVFHVSPIDKKSANCLATKLAPSLKASSKKKPSH